MLNRTSVVLALGLSLAFTAISDPAFAAKKKSSPKPSFIHASDVFSVGVRVKVGKKFKTMNVSCLDSVPGMTQNVKGGLVFNSYSKLASRLQKAGGRSPKLPLYKALAQAGKSACTKPDFLSLEKYKGPFGAAEARTLYDRFGFGATPEQINDAVAKGLDRTVAELTTYVAEPWLEQYEAELRCDARPADDFDNETCDPYNPNDIYDIGTEFGFVAHMWYTSKPYFDRMAFFLHNERMAARGQTVGGSDGWALIAHINMLRSAAITGDYRQFIKDYTRDYLGHLRALSGATNRGFKPNEDFGREIMELGTTGPHDLNDKPVYTDLDVASAALAESGWKIDCDEELLNPDPDHDGYWICRGGYFEGLHAQGPKLMYAGTSQAAIVYNSDDLVSLLFNHPRTAEHLAEDIWSEFIGAYANPTAIKDLAKVIRSNNYNLNATMRQVMTSRAMFAARNRKSLIKHPVEKLIGFLRTSGIPVYGYWNFYNMFEDMGQHLLSPPTVFGWNEKKLAHESHILDWRNALVSILNSNTNPETISNSDSDREKFRKQHKRTFSYFDRFLAGLNPAQDPAGNLVNRINDWFNLDLNDAQKGLLAHFMNCKYVSCSGSSCNGLPDKESCDGFYPDASNFDSNERRVKSLLALVAELPQYGVK
ncbi:MAG: DUF1800 domain-containing protein [Oligoflexia bacterium]|nr:DUF1800 domain-containing protein [Oligoflexia bacterium]